MISFLCRLHQNQMHFIVFKQLTVVILNNLKHLHSSRLILYKSKYTIQYTVTNRPTTTKSFMFAT